jgi:beta-lactamase regulating signal transducer with metallopeptidase domain/Flp pilus assembly protein TadD
MTTLFELAARLQSANAAEGMLWMVVKATLILAIARLLLAALPRASAATKHLIATAALIGVAVMPVVTFLLPAWEVAVQSRAASSAVPAQPGPVTEAAALGNSQRETVGVSDQEPTPLATAVSVVKATGLADTPISAIERSAKVIGSTWKGMIVIVLAAGALLLLAHMLAGMFGVWLVVRRAEEITTDDALLELDAARDRLALGREVRLLRSSRVAVPVVWGIFRPVLLLPYESVLWPVERLRVVLLHELSHLKRSDGVSLILTRAALSLFWFHPLAWSLERAGRSECERACDDLVLAGGTKPSEYADQLLEIAKSMPAFDPFRSVTLAMSRKTQLEGRLLSILQRDVVRRVFSARSVAIACALAVAVIIPLSALRLIAGPAEEKKVQAKIEQAPAKSSDAEVTVTPDIEAIGDFLLARLGKYDKRADRWLREPRNAEERYERAYDLYRNDRYEDAAAAFRRSADEGYRRETALYNAACSWALLGNADRALNELDAALVAGWDDLDKIAEDSDFDPIRSDPRFARMLETRIKDVATRRVTETVERFTALKEGRTPESDSDSIAESIAGGIAEAIHGGIREGIHDGIHEGIDGALRERTGDQWFGVGYDLLRLRRLDQSIEAFQKAIALDTKVSAATYNVACAYSLKGDARNGMVWLEKAIDNGFSDEEKFEHDPDIAHLRKQPGFEALQQKAADLEMRGCCQGKGRWVYDNWSESLQHHRQIATKYPSSGRAWFNLGFVALQARDFNTGLEAFRHTLELKYRTGTSSYNMACAYALQGNKDAAFDWLRRARAAGFAVAHHADSDDDLDSLRRDPRWDEMGLDQEKHAWKSDKK